MSRHKVLAVDFDGTICKYQHFKDGVIWQEPQEGAQEILAALRVQGWKIIVHTCRVAQIHADYQESIIAVAEWLKKHNIEVDGITAEKPIATAYIDDRGLRFTNWQDIKNYFI